MADVFWCSVSRQHVRLQRHYHDTYAFGFIDQGLSRYDCGSHQFQTDPKTLFLINPGDVHTGYPASSEPISYTTFHVEPAYVRAFTGQGHDRPFGQYLCTQPGVGAALREAAREHQGDLACLAIENMLALVLPAVLCDGRLPGHDTLHPTGLRRARELLLSDLRQTVSLAELAQAANLERAYFARQFRRCFGLPPHQMLKQARVVAARQRLFTETIGADVAQDVGFCDQSHMLRSWKDVYAVPPSKMKKVNIVQSP
jgi:AraC-like DNA-binding protein